MKLGQISKLAVCVTAMCLLGSCSRSYDIDLLLRDGKVVFKFSSGWLDRSRTANVTWLIVRELSRSPRSVWQLQSVDYNGRSISELGYGTVPSGMKQQVAAEPLRVGQLYRVELLALGGAGSEEFVISPEADLGQSERVRVLRK